MPKKTGPRGPYERKDTICCAWCNEPFEVVKVNATTCSGACRSRLFRYRTRTGFDPAFPPGRVTVESALADLIAELLAAERVRRIHAGYINSLPSWKRPPGE